LIDVIAKEEERQTEIDCMQTQIDTQTHRHRENWIVSLVSTSDPKREERLD